MSAWQRLRPTSKPSKRRALDYLLKLGVLGVAGGVLLVAGGITITKLGGNIAFECLLAASFSVATLVVALAQSLLGWRLKNYWLLVSGISLTASMSLALLYALRLWFPLPWLHIPLMWALHGSLQVFGYTLCGCIGWLHASSPGSNLEHANGWRCLTSRHPIWIRDAINYQLLAPKVNPYVSSSKLGPRSTDLA